MKKTLIPITLLLAAVVGLSLALASCNVRSQKQASESPITDTASAVAPGVSVAAPEPKMPMPEAKREEARAKPVAPTSEPAPVTAARPSLTTAAGTPAKAPAEIMSRERLGAELRYSGEKEKSDSRLFGGVRLDGVQPAISADKDASYKVAGTDVEGKPVFNTEAYDRIRENPFLNVLDAPLSTFSIDVDTASYSNVRRFINQGRLPPPDAVRIEEMINYFTYHYPAPGPKDDKPFAVHVETANCPWALEHRLVRVGLKGKEIPRNDRPLCNLVFLLDVSGSMAQPNKLPLVKSAMKMLVENLTENDRVAIVVYAGASGLALPSTCCDEKQKVLDALEQLKAGGSTNGAEGIQLAYKTAEENFIKKGVNRVILCTDGDFNVGVTNQGELTRLIEEKAKSGVFLSIFGFGMGNYKDSTLQKLADKGNGNYGYIDTLNEARKALVEQMSGTLVTIAKDVKIQVEFNPSKVAAYRLVGYEKRMLRAQDFNDDKKDAGEIGAGHTVTALYEVVLAGARIPPSEFGASKPDPKALTPDPRISNPESRVPNPDVPAVDPLKYQTPRQQTAAAASPELLTVKLRYKAPDGDKSSLIDFPVMDSGARIDKASDDFIFATAVASFGMILRDSEHKDAASLDTVIELAQSAKGPDASGYRAEFISLAQKVKGMMK